MFKLQQRGPMPVGKLEKRLRELPSHQIQGWADAYLNEVGQYLLLYTREGGPEPLARAEESAAALLAAVRELKSRNGG